MRVCVCDMMPHITVWLDCAAASTTQAMYQPVAASENVYSSMCCEFVRVCVCRSHAAVCEHQSQLSHA